METIPDMWRPHDVNPQCPPDVGVALDCERPCVHCGQMTAVWWGDRPGHRPGTCGDVGHVAGDTPPVRVLRDLEGPLAPRKRGRDPYWRCPMPPPVWKAHILRGFAWKTKRKVCGESIVLDLNGAWLAAASSVEVVHGEFSHTGPCAFERRPGYYQVRVYPWHDKTMPSPLGQPRADADTVWVPEPTMRLLHGLTASDRWPEAEILDSWTGDGVRLRRWAEAVRDQRADALVNHGRDSAEYIAIKKGFGEALSLMIGGGVPRRWRCKAARPDWTHAIQAQATANLWHKTDIFRRVLPAGRGPIAVRNVDELVVPIVPDDLREYIDNSGLRLGLFKIKRVESS